MEECFMQLPELIFVTRAARKPAQFNMQTDITDWLTAGTRVSFARKEVSRADTWYNIYQYLWRWGSFFLPSGTIDGYDPMVISMQKQAARKKTTTDIARFNVFAKANITKDLSLNADFTYEINNMNSGSSDYTVFGYDWMGTYPKYKVSSSNTGTWRDNSKANKWKAISINGQSFLWRSVRKLCALSNTWTR